MKTIYFLESILDKIFKYKYLKVLFCSIMCVVSAIFGIIVFTRISFTDSFLEWFIISIAIFILARAIFISTSLLCLVLKKLNTKFNLNKEIKNAFNNIYLKDKKKFYSKSEMVLFYFGEALSGGFFIYVIYMMDSLNYILFFSVLYLLFIIFYRLLLHIVYKKH